jgi:hypothetical protein
MKKKLYAIALAAMLAVSMNAFAGEGKSCDKKDAAHCKTASAKCDKDHKDCCKNGQSAEECKKACDAKKDADKKPTR